MKEKIGTLFLLSVMLLSLCGCSEEPQSEIITEPSYVEEADRLAEPIPAAASFAGGSGTEEDPYQIGTAEQLALLAKLVSEKNEEYVSAFYVQTQDIAMNDVSDLDSWNEKAPDRGWTPIGTKYTTDFQGNYDGGGYRISGMYIYYVNDAKYMDVGLFGCIYKGCVKNVNLVDSYVYSAGEHRVAGIIGEAQYSQILNCTSNATVETQDGIFVGGICGKAGNETRIENCENAGRIEGAGRTNNILPELGGICGSSFCDIVNCRNTGAVISPYHAGGICGNVTGSIENCENSGTITAQKDAGGITANGGTVVQHCLNSGSVTGGGYGGVGGIVGVTSGSIESCTNEGKISSSGSSSTVGGIAGNLFGSNDEGLTSAVSQCTNNGMIDCGDGAMHCGGIIGYCGTGKDNTLVENCINNAAVHTAKGEAGGVAGRLCAENSHELAVVDCVNYGEISTGEDSFDFSGGISGYTNPWGGTIRLENCRNEADIAGKNCSGLSYSVVIPDGQLECVNCVNTGNVTVSEGFAGGLFSFVSGGNVRFSACRNEGNVTTKDSMEAGGLVGHLDGGEIQFVDCVNRGNVTVIDGSSVFVGGIIGAVVASDSLQVHNCSNSGALTVHSASAISAETYEENEDGILFILIGGITGSSRNPECYTNCTNTGTITVTGAGLPVARTGDVIGLVLES